MSDLVDRLRALPWHEPAIAEAADEIERLTALLKKYEYPPEHRVSVAEQRIAELEGHYKRIKSQTCMCRFDKAEGEGEPGTVPSSECEYHKILRETIERLEAQVEALQNRCAQRGLSPEDSDALMAENERLRAALHKIANSSFTPTEERLIAKAALKGVDDE